MAKKILVETSARHVHLSQADLEALFGPGYQLTHKKDLSQPGQYACAERVTVVGAIFLMIISAIPVFTQVVWAGSSSNTLSLGGTGLIIITGVALETTKQIKTMITRKEYHGYIRK